MTGYYSEMNQARPVDTQIDANLSHTGKHYFLRAIPGIKLVGRGVEFLGTETAETLVPGSKYVGWNRYKVTIGAFEKIDKQYKIASEMLL